MGLRTSPLWELFFDDCRVPASNVLGRVGGGFMVLDHVMKREILFSFIVNVGEMQHRLDRCVEYAKTRVQFGKPIGSFQSIANKIVDMKIQLETARKWLYDTGERLMAGENVTTDLAIAKLLTSEATWSRACRRCRSSAATATCPSTGLEKDVRNAVAGTIYSGTNGDPVQPRRVDVGSRPVIQPGPGTPVLKVCGATTTADVDLLAAAGADLVGLWHGVPGGGAELSLPDAVSLAGAARAAAARAGAGDLRQGRRAAEHGAAADGDPVGAAARLPAARDGGGVARGHAG